VAFAEKIHQRRLQAELEDQQMQPRLVNLRHNLAEQHVHLALAFLDNRVEAKQLDNAQKERQQNEHAKERGPEGDEEVNHGRPP
jgi:hypothetical protein